MIKQIFGYPLVVQVLVNDKLVDVSEAVEVHVGTHSTINHNALLQLVDHAERVDR